MQDDDQLVSLGFTRQSFPRGIHVCQIFSDDGERQEAVLNFVLSGLQAKERTRCFSDETNEQVIERYLSEHGISLKAARNSGLFALAKASENYFKNDLFDPDRMLEELAQFQKTSIAEGYCGTRIIGEMPPQVQHVDGGYRLPEYESRVSLFLRDFPINAVVCQYDARVFDGATLMEVLKVHPFMVIRDMVISNPFAIAPEEYLASRRKAS